MLCNFMLVGVLMAQC